MFRAVLALVMAVALALPAAAQQAGEPASAGQVDRSATGGAQTLEDILARQRGEKVDYGFRRQATGDPETAAGISQQLGTLGGVSDPELWRALRYGSADITASSGGEVGAVLIQDGGMRWLAWREGPIARYGGYLLLGMIVFLALFFVVRGRIRIDGEKTGRTVTRFGAIERFGHWLLAGSFVLLALTGLITLFGRMALIPLMGKEAYAPLAQASKLIHNNVAWAFIAGLILVFLQWVLQNLPSRADVKWLLVAGGLLTRGVHPPAWKFNAGQKLIFWAVIVLGASIALTGLSLLFPFQLPMFAATFEKLNALGLPQAVGLGELRTALSPQEEMQFAQMWHSIVAFVLMAIIIAHIYIGSLGMEGAYAAVGSGEVEEQWAREHHSLWVAQVLEEEQHVPSDHVPAE
jgi:formate dehydrogenase subunit gamma